MGILRGLEICLYALGGLGALYSLLLALVAAVSRPRRPAGCAPAQLAVLVPAHNEAEIIGLLLRDLRSQSVSPATILVAADHCTDGTERIAVSGGAQVLELRGEHRGKSAALVAGFESLAERDWDVVLAVDADCRVDPNFVGGVRCSPMEVVQATYYLCAQSPSDLMYEFLSRLENRLFHAGRARLGFPAFLLGTGMLLGRRALQRCPWSAAGLTEDRAQGFAFLRAGVPVRYAEGIAVWAPTPHGWRQSWTQRRRWSSTNLLRAVLDAACTAWKLLPHVGPRALELPFGVLADARSQWLVLLLAGCLLGVLRGGPWWVGLALLLANATVAAAAGFVWYGSGFLRVLWHAPRSAVVALGSAALALLGRAPARWQRGH